MVTEDSGDLVTPLFVYREEEEGVRND